MFREIEDYCGSFIKVDNEMPSFNQLQWARILVNNWGRSSMVFIVAGRVLLLCNPIVVLAHHSRSELQKAWVVVVVEPWG